LSLSLHTRALDDHSTRPAARRRRRCCQVASCGGPFAKAVEIQLPAAWEASRTYTVLTVRVDACDEHVAELDRRGRDVLEVRAVIGTLLAVVEAAAVTDAAQREQIASAERALRKSRNGSRR
jgi:hypothetical protein